MQVMHEGGVFTTRTVDRNSRDWGELTALNAALAPSLGMVRGVATLNTSVPTPMGGTTF